MLRKVIRDIPKWLPLRGVATAALEANEFPPDSQRTGVIAVKAGMTQEWDSYGAWVPLTVLWIDNCQVRMRSGTDLCGKDVVEVTDVRKAGKGKMHLELGCGFVKEKNSTEEQKRRFDELGMPLKRTFGVFKVTEDGVLPVGTELTAAHYVPGQYIDVKGTTIGKGFQGVMKRWGFAGGPASHGASKSHRSAGSIGASQDPGKVWKGKKMAGRMGGKIRMVHNVWIHKVDAGRNLIYVRGQVPGHKGNFVYLRDAQYKPQHPNVPFPTHSGPLPDISIAEPAKDPYRLFRRGKA